jgi:hypothetical protein
MDIQSPQPAVGLHAMRHHLGIGFEVWKAQESWYWLVARPGLNGGAIGAAATEAGAMRDACWSIEEMTASREEMTAQDPETLPAGAGDSRQPVFQRSDSITEKAKCWEATPANLQRYLSCLECSAV